MTVYIVYRWSSYEIDYPAQSCDVVGVCSSRERAFKMIQEYGERIEQECREEGNEYFKTTQHDNWMLRYDISNRINESVSVYCTAEELDKIISDEDS